MSPNHPALRPRRASRLALKTLTFGLALFGPLAVGSSQAQEVTEASPPAADAPAVEIMDFSLNELMDPEITTASKVAEKATESPATVHVISREDIRLRGYSTLADVLKDLPGMETTEQYYSEMGTLVPVRGVIGNNKIVLLINGMRINPPGGEELMIRSDLSVRFADQIEVIYGPGSTLYGQDAISAVVNIKTQKPGDAIAEAVAGYGNHDTREGFASINTRLREQSNVPLTFSAYASYRSSDLASLKSEYPQWWELYRGYLSAIPGRVDQFERGDLGYSVFARIASDSASLQAWFRDSTRSSAEGRGGVAALPILWWVPEAKWRDKTLAVEGQYALRLTNHLTLHSISSFNRYEIDPETRYVHPNGMGGFNLWDFKYAIGTSVSLEERLDVAVNESVRFMLGVAATNYDITPKATIVDGSDPDGDIVSQAGMLSYYTAPNDPASRVDVSRAINLHYYNLGVYGEGSYKPFESLKTIAGVRVDLNSRFDATPVSPRAALIYTGLGGKLALKYVFSMAYVAPAPAFAHNVYENSAQIGIGNPNLKPERSRSSEINASWKSGNMLMSLSGFYNTQSDLLTIAQTEIPETLVAAAVYKNPDGTNMRVLRQSINLGTSTAYGADLSGRMHWGPVSSWASYSYIEFKRKLGTLESGLPQISHHNVRAGVTATLFSKLSLTPSLVLRSTPANLPDSFKLQGTSMKVPYEVNLNVVYSPTRNADAFLTMRNITNHHYAVRGVSGPALQEPIWGIGGVRLRY
jgi:outer membrane receptor protein involved in Fe transport